MGHTNLNCAPLSPAAAALVGLTEIKEAAIGKWVLGSKVDAALINVDLATGQVVVGVQADVRAALPLLLTAFAVPLLLNICRETAVEKAAQATSYDKRSRGVWTRKDYERDDVGFATAFWEVCIYSSVLSVSGGGGCVGLWRLQRMWSVRRVWWRRLWWLGMWRWRLTCHLWYPCSTQWPPFQTPSPPLPFGGMPVVWVRQLSVSLVRFGQAGGIGPVLQGEGESGASQARSQKRLLAMGHVAGYKMTGGCKTLRAQLGGRAEGTLRREREGGGGASPPLEARIHTGCSTTNWGPLWQLPLDLCCFPCAAPPVPSGLG